MYKKFALFFFTILVLCSRFNAQNVQLVHNCSNDDASDLTIWVNDTIWISPFSYKNATVPKPFAAGQYTMAVTGVTANSLAQAITQTTFTIQANQNHFILINGLVSANTQTPNNSTHPLSIKDFSTGLAGNPSPFQASVKVYHGDVMNSSIAVDIEGIEMPVNYNDFANVGLLTANSKTIGVDGETSSLGSYLAPLQNYAGTHVNIVSSGGPSESFNLNIVPAGGGTLIPLAHIVSPAGIASNEEATLFCVASPNPAKESVSVQHSKSQRPLNFELRDLTGRIIKYGPNDNLNSENFKIDLLGLNSGIYFLLIEFPETKKTIRLIKE